MGYVNGLRRALSLSASDLFSDAGLALAVHKQNIDKRLLPPGWSHPRASGPLILDYTKQCDNVEGA